MKKLSIPTFWLLLTCSVFAQAQSEKLLDCPLRDMPFSLDTPVMDVLLNDAAHGIMQKELAAAKLEFPAFLKQAQAPSLSAILQVKNLLEAAQAPASVIDRVERQLSALPITEADKQKRCARYDNQVPIFKLTKAPRQILVFNKINGYHHGPSVNAATLALEKLAAELGWGLSVTDKGGAMNAKTLAQFDLVVWNNVSGDVLTLSQRQAFENYIEQGGAYLGIHGSGGDFVYFWDWYAKTLVGAQFIGHPVNPQFQTATLHLENPNPSSAATSWKMNDEWYSFRESPRNSSSNIRVSLDETSYTPGYMGGTDLRMGDDHPIAWSRCIKKGRSFYSAIGHRPEVYEVPENIALLKQGLIWLADSTSTCL